MSHVYVFQSRIHTARMCTATCRAVYSHVYAIESRVPHCTHEPSRTKEKRATHMLCSKKCEHKQQHHTQSRAAPPHAITSSTTIRNHEQHHDAQRLMAATECRLVMCSRARTRLKYETQASTRLNQSKHKTKLKQAQD